MEGFFFNKKVVKARRLGGVNATSTHFNWLQQGVKMYIKIKGSENQDNTGYAWGVGSQITSQFVGARRSSSTRSKSNRRVKVKTKFSSTSNH